MANPNIIVISDYGVGDPAFTEVILQLKTLLPDAYIIPQSAPAFSTINTGFWIYQIALTKNLTNTYIYSNTAPRKTDLNAQKNNGGEKLMRARLDNGFEIMAVNAGYIFSFVKPYIKDFHFVNVSNEGSQFRSRDNYPKSVFQMIQKDNSFIAEKADTRGIPDEPKNVIASVDGYGNIKTTVRKNDINYSPGEKLNVALNGKNETAIYTDGVFNIQDGEFAFAPGSSGHDNRFMELFVRGKSAFELFGKPNIEQKMEIHILKK